MTTRAFVPETERTWGPWTLDPELLTLDHPLYQIDLETCTSSAEVLDWIMQVGHKVFADDATLAGLVRALNDCLRPQATLCSNGQPTTIGAAAIADLVVHAALRRPI